MGGKHRRWKTQPNHADWPSTAKCAGTGPHESIPKSCDSVDWCPKHDADLYAFQESRHRASEYA